VVLPHDPIEHRECFLEIRDPSDGHRVVTVIEVISPANKPPGEGRDLYLRKQRVLIEARISLVEIDLLRAGPRAVAIPGEKLWDVQYLVAVTRSTAPDRREAYPLSVRDRLPRVAIPLRPPDPDVVLDLPAIFAEVYEKGGYGLRIDYRRAPEPPLPAADALWAKGIREIAAG
jgi:hypothetical protein